MGLFQRISDLLRSNINDLISKAEDPEKLLAAAIEDMQRQLLEAKSRVAMSIADEKRLAKQFDTERTKGEDWEKKAMAAVRAGRDDLAIEALSRKKDHQAAASLYEEQLEGQRAAVEHLKKALAELSTKLDETKRKRALLVARAKRAEAQRHIAHTLSAVHGAGSGDRLERFEARVERVEAEAEAVWEMAQLSGRERDLSEEIALLEAGSLRDDLRELKGKMETLGLLDSGLRPALPAPSEHRSDTSNAEPRARVESESASGDDEVREAEVLSSQPRPSPETMPEPERERDLESAASGEG